MSAIAYACFECRIAMKREQNADKLICPNCGGTMYYMGWSFHAPKKRDTEQWKKVQWLFAEGFLFFGSGWRTDVPLPERLRDVKKFLEDYPDHALRVRPRTPKLLP